MKKVIYFIAAALMVVSFVSCSDMLDSKSDRYVYDPALDQKVDSMFYINGILKGVQQAIDQTVLTNELRGDLLSTSANASTDLRRLAAFDYADGNQYDSAYVCSSLLKQRTSANLAEVPYPDAESCEPNIEDAYMLYLWNNGTAPTLSGGEE